MASQPSNEDQHQEAEFRYDTKTELEAEVKEYPQEPPCVEQEGREKSLIHLHECSVQLDFEKTQLRSAKR